MTETTSPTGRPATATGPAVDQATTVAEARQRLEDALRDQGMPAAVYERRRAELEQAEADLAAQFSGYVQTGAERLAERLDRNATRLDIVQRDASRFRQAWAAGQLPASDTTVKALAALLRTLEGATSLHQAQEAQVETMLRQISDGPEAFEATLQAVAPAIRQGQGFSW